MRAAGESSDARSSLSIQRRMRWRTPESLRTHASFTSHLWQAGGSVRSQKLLGGLTYDFVSLEDSGDSEHWFGIAIDGARHLRLSYAVEANGDWSGEGGFARGDLFLGGGVTERDGAPRTIFASVEWIPPQPRGRRGLKAISR